jgi:hypothetical protein
MAVNFFWSTVHRMLGEITTMISLSHHNMKHVELNGGPNDPRIKNDPNLPDTIDQTIKTIDHVLDLADKHLASLKSAHIDRALQSLGLWRTMVLWPWSELNTRARAARDAIETELRHHLYYQYPKQKGEKLILWKEDWKTSLAAFPAIQREVFDATDCYGLGHNTASVFYSMRIAEHGLRALAKERKVRLAKNKPLEWGTWQEIIRTLDNEIKEIGAKKKAGAAKDAALEFYSGARADLNGFKDEYRNLVSHVRATYDDVQAFRALTTVNAFMERIAVKIDNKHHRIRWGLR